MDERVEEIKPISRVRPIRKVGLARPRRGRREMMYQLNRYHKAIKPKRKNFVKTKKQVKKPLLRNFSQSENLVEDVKKRIAFDRAIILGE